jgi:hypothetical protein
MSEGWYYNHAGAIHGPVSADELRRLAWTGGLLPADLIWAAGVDPTAAVPAEAALALEPAPLAQPVHADPPTTPLPEWVHELAEVLADVRDATTWPNPPPTSWLSDVQPDERVVQPKRPT